MKTNNYQVKELKIDELKPSNHNPATRIKNNKQLQRLIHSIERYGLQYPILVSSTKQIIEGHRRWAACRFLKWETIPCFVAGTETNIDELYGEINHTCRRHTGNETLKIYLSNPNAIERITRSNYQAMESVLGRDLLMKMAKKGLSIKTYRQAVYLANIAENCRPETLKQIMEYFLQFNVSEQMKRAIDFGTSPNSIMKAISNKVQMKLKLSLGDH